MTCFTKAIYNVNPAFATLTVDQTVLYNWSFMPDNIPMQIMSFHPHAKSD